MLIPDELSSKIAASAAAFVVRKSRTLGLPVAKSSALRENRSRCVSSQSGVRGTSCVTIDSSSGFWNAVTPISAGASSVSGVSGGAFTYGEAPLCEAAAVRIPTPAPPPSPPERIDRGVEPDERRALVVAGVLVGLRVAVEVPARERRGQRPAERVPAADELALALAPRRHLARDDGVPVLDRLLEADVAQEGRLLVVGEAGEGVPVHLAAVEVVAERHARVACLHAGAHAAVVLEAVRAPVDPPDLDHAAPLGRAPDRVPRDLVERAAAGEDARHQREHRVRPG